MTRLKSDKDEMGFHARLYCVIARSPAWLALSPTSRAFYMDLRMQLKSTNNGNISAPHSVMKALGYRSPATVAKALRELETMGLIVKTRQGGITAGGRNCNLFRFTDKASYEFLQLGIFASKATHEWRRWKSVKEAEEALQQAHDSAKRPDYAKRMQGSTCESTQFT